MPVIFKDLGKGAKDLLGKKYDYSNELKTVTKAEGGMNIEAVACGADKGIGGSATVTYKDKSWGELETKFGTCGGIGTKAKLTGLVPNGTVTLSGCNKLKGKVEVDYKLDALTVQFDLGSCLKSSVQASADIVDGLVGGCKAEFDFSNGADLKDYNFGLQYGFSKDLTLACVTSKGRSLATLSACQKLSSTDSYAISMGLNTSTYASCLTVGLEKKLDSATTVKAKLNSCGALSTVVEHKLSDPRIKFNVAAEFDATTPDLATKKFGLGLVLGDY